MSVWWIRGKEAGRFDGIRFFGRPPVLSPPAWALAEQVWRGIGAELAPASGTTSHSWDALRAELPVTPKRIALVVPDGTRVGPWRPLLREMLPMLRAAAPHARHTLLVASGVHAVLPRAALEHHLVPEGGDPAELLEGWEVIQNGDNMFRDHIPVGSTPAGTPVRLHPAYVESDYRILLGEISWHYFAGFGGGRKLVFPGLGEPAGIAGNHRRAVSVPSEAEARPEQIGLEHLAWRSECGPGLLRGSPVHEDLEEAVSLCPPQWVVTAVDDPPPDPDPADPRFFPAAVVQGPYPVGFESATRHFESKHRITFTQAPAVMLADAGGSPRDATFLQAHKSLQHALRFLAPGGRLLLIAECGEGLGSPMLARYASAPESFRPLAGASADPMAVLHIQTVTALRRAVGAAEVALWSDLPGPAVRAIGMHPCASRDEALDWVRAESGSSWGWLPRAERFLPEAGWRGGCLR